MVRDFVLEIGTEEIPARFMGPAISQMEEIAGQWLDSNRLVRDSAAAYGTPRRLVMYIARLAERQEEFTEEIS